MKLLPPDVAAHVTLHINLPAYKEFSALKKFASKCVRVMAGLHEARKRQQRPDHLKLVEARDYDDHNDNDDQNDNNNDSHNDNNDDGFHIPDFDAMEVPQQVDIMAFMKAKGFQPAGRGAKGRFVLSPGGPGQPGSRSPYGVVRI